VVEQVDAACKDLGFLVVTGHGVPAEIIEGMYGAFRAFFDQPLESKKACAPPAPDIFLGYRGMDETGLAYSQSQAAPPDLRECYSFGRTEEMPPDYVRALGAGNRLAPNVWPASPPDFRAAFAAYESAMQDLARRLLAIFEVALGLPRGFFDAKIDKNNSFMLGANYPSLAAPPLPGQMRAGAHTDFGLLSILYQDDAPGGLQVERPDGSWVDIPPVPGSFVINLGDIMAHWTNDTWVSSMHRVVPPPERAASSRRQSIVYFFHPNYDAVIECMPSCTGPDRPVRHPPAIAHEFMLGKTSRSFQMDPA
jgi:isopenicillin N synthase-like dioxygenase